MEHERIPDYERADELANKESILRPAEWAKTHVWNSNSTCQAYPSRVHSDSTERSF